MEEGPHGCWLPIPKEIHAKESEKGRTGGGHALDEGQGGKEGDHFPASDVGGAKLKSKPLDRDVNVKGEKDRSVHALKLDMLAKAGGGRVHLPLEIADSSAREENVAGMEQAAMATGPTASPQPTPLSSPSPSSLAAVAASISSPDPLTPRRKMRKGTPQRGAVSAELLQPWILSPRSRDILSAAEGVTSGSSISSSDEEMARAKSERENKKTGGKRKVPGAAKEEDKKAHESGDSEEGPEMDAVRRQKGKGNLGDDKAEHRQAKAFAGAERGLSGRSRGKMSMETATEADVLLDEKSGSGSGSSREPSIECWERIRRRELGGEGGKLDSASKGTVEGRKRGTTGSREGKGDRTPEEEKDVSREHDVDESEDQKSQEQGGPQLHNRGICLSVQAASQRLEAAKNLTQTDPRRCRRRDGQREMSVKLKVGKSKFTEARDSAASRQQPAREAVHSDRVQAKKPAERTNVVDPSWQPPQSPYGLIQEKLYKDPWKLLVACILLNKTAGQQMHAVIWKLFGLIPTPEAAVAAKTEDIAEIIHYLGLQNKRALMVQRFSREYLHDDWMEITQLHGIGKYAADAHAIFCEGRWREVNPQDHMLAKYWQWLHRTHGEGFAFREDD
eukprot:TRINITY_DN9550_c0_g3_i1.p1 TRINITY_DN9550_c0_g3~~TRINITY_DN9550_c0_g3_i1.p1  ORF type:complete len:658 (-),score=184.86 TRINITY_DN9550_c0_g3_i1:146-1999(-)